MAGAAVLWIGAAVLGGGAAGYWAYRNAKENEKRGQAPRSGTWLRWAPVVSPASAGVVVHGSF